MQADGHLVPSVKRTRCEGRISIGYSPGSGLMEQMQIQLAEGVSRLVWPDEVTDVPWGQAILCLEDCQQYLIFYSLLNW